jgi:spore germination protein YaaH/putative cell wall-binding protein
VLHRRIRLIAALLVAMLVIVSGPLAPTPEPASASGIDVSGLAQTSPFQDLSASTASSATGATAGSPNSPSAQSAPVGGQVPSQMYLDDLAHQSDHRAFAVGVPVSVPFQPRPTDHWSVDGRTPRAIPLTVASPGAAPNGTLVLPPGSQPPLASGSNQGLLTLGTNASAMGASSQDALSTAPADGLGSGPAIAVGANGLRREVFGFLPYWELGYASLDYSALSTIAYFAINANPDGSLDTSSPGWPGWNSQALTSVIDAAHASGTRVVLVVERFAWTSSQYTAATTLLSSSTARQALANNIAAAVVSRGVDGVNLDFEPIPSGQSANFVDLVRRIRSALDAKAAGYQLTVDTMGWPGNYDIKGLTASGAADAVVIMGYDYRNGSSGTAGSIDPLGGPTYDLTDTINNYLSLTSASKVILAVPYYGRAWTTTSSSLDATTVSDGCSVSATYATIVDTVLPGLTRQWDPTESTAWLTYPQPATTCHSGTVTRELYYDDAQSLGLRYDLVNAAGLRGTGMWALGYDGSHTELYTMLKTKFLGDQPQAGVVNLPPVVTDEGFAVDWRGVDSVASVSSYDIQVSVDGGGYVAWLTGTSTTSAIYLGTTGHAYAFRARAHSTAGGVGPWNVVDVYTVPQGLAVGGFAQVTAAGAGVNVRWSPDTSTSSNILGQATAGTIGRIIGGPVSSGGYSWYELIWPLQTWGTVGDGPYVGVWMAAASGSTAWLAPVVPPNSTRVQAGISGLSFGGSGTASLGPTGASDRLITPNGNGELDTLQVDWTDALVFSDMTMSVLRSDGSLVGSVDLGARGAGSQSYTWDGRVGGSVVPNGTYLLRLDASSGATRYSAPSAGAPDAAQIARFGVTVHSIDLDRYGGSDRYETAALFAIGNFAAGSGTAVYVANGYAYPDALSGAAAAGSRHGPLLLVTATTIPASTAAALSRLHPSRIFVLGGTGVISDTVLRQLGSYAPTARLAGPDRYATAAAVSADAFPAGAPVVYLVNGYDIPDALTGGAAAARDGGPILLTTATGLPEATRNELLRLHPSRVVILGGTAVFSPGLQALVASLGSWSIVRYGGADRYATALQIAATYSSAASVFIDRGYDYPDGLAASALGGPLVLLPQGTTPSSVIQGLQRLDPNRLVLMGGTGVLPDALATALRASLGG